MKLFLIVLLSLLCYHGSTGYPAFEGGLSRDFPFENGTAIESRFDASNETASNDSLPLNMHWYGNKVVEKVKEGIKTVKDKVKGGFDKVKDKVKGGFDKVKEKIKDFKDKIGSKGGSGGGSGGGYYRDKYDRDYDRDRYDRDYDRDRYDRDYDRDRYNRKESDYSGGSIDPTTQKIGVGIGIFIAVGGVLFVIVMKLREMYGKN